MEESENPYQSRKRKKTKIMKTIRKIVSAVLCLLFVSFSYSQETQEAYEKRKKEMFQEEAKIAVFIAKHLHDDIPKLELNKFYESLKHDEEHEKQDGYELTVSEIEKKLLYFKKSYQRKQYFVHYPASRSIYSVAAAPICSNGGFESNSFADYTGNYAYDSDSGYSGGNCMITAANFSLTVPTSLATAHVGNFDIMSVGTDPYVTLGTLNKVYSGAHSARINSDLDAPGFTRPENSVSRLVKKVLLTEDNQEIFFKYALVMVNPGGHTNTKPTFKANLLDSNSNICDWICTVASATDTFLRPSGSQIDINNPILYKKWECGSLQACGMAGDSVVLEFLMTDCGAGGHWGYAYIDEICDTCIIDTCDTEGNIRLNPTDTCTGDTMQVCGTYNLAAIDCNSSVADEIRLYIYQNGVQVAGPFIESSPSGGTFCFTVDPSHFPIGASGGYDFYTEIDFDFGGTGVTTKNDINTNPGTNNDYIINPQCCPEFFIYTCCDLEGGLASNTRLALTGMPIVSPVVRAKITAYNKEVRKKYPIKSTLVDSCCMYCEFPDVPFPVFIYDENGSLVDTYTYSVSWSHNPTNTYATDSILPDSITTVTVTGPGTCVWSDTFSFTCCDDYSELGVCCDTFELDLDIDSICNFDPCTQPSTQFPLVIKLNGTVLGYSGYYFTWSNGSHANQISASANQLPVYAIVYDSSAGCSDSVWFDLDCTPPCVPTIPTNLRCVPLKSGRTLSWDPIPGMTYELIITWNDPSCCRGGTASSQVIPTPNSYHFVSDIRRCFSWRVRSICPDGTASQLSAKLCACPPPCTLVIPRNLRCRYVSGGRNLTWDAVPGVTYEVVISENDPACCRNARPGRSRLYTTTTPSFFVSSRTSCFSWRVRSICPRGSSSWSRVQCSCPGPIVVGPGGLSTKLKTQPKGTSMYNENMKVVLVPNPVRDFVTFEVETKDIEAEQGTILITSLTGGVVYTSMIKLNGTTLVDLSNLDAGTYLYKIMSGQVHQSGRIVITD